MYNKAYYEDFKVLCFAIIGTACAECGSINDLQIDHVDWRTKSFTITSKLGPKWWPAVVEELKKCQPLCRLCHKKKTAKDHAEIFTKERDSLHGTLSQYWRYRCRCEPCRNAYRQYRSTRYSKPIAARRIYRKAVCGSNAMYRKGCRCRDCRTAHAIAARKKV